MSAIDQQIIAVTRTCYGVFLQTCKNIGAPFSLIANTTLNEKLSIQANVAPSASEIPNMTYLVIGNLGHATVTADDGSDETIPVPHRASDAGLYGQIPFVLRETTDDLPAGSFRDKFCLRRQETHNGKTYYAYYGLRLDFSTVVPQLQKVEIINGEVVVTQFVPTTDNLNPPRPEITNSGVVLGSNSSVTAAAIVTITLDADMIAEIINAHKVRTGSVRSPVISEIGLVSGVNRSVAANSGSGGSFQFKEVIAAQINVHISTYHAVGYSSNKMDLTLDIGGVEPLLGTDSVGSATWLS